MRDAKQLSKLLRQYGTTGHGPSLERGLLVEAADCIDGFLQETQDEIVNSGHEIGSPRTIEQLLNDEPAPTAKPGKRGRAGKR